MLKVDDRVMIGDEFIGTIAYLSKEDNMIILKDAKEGFTSDNHYIWQLDKEIYGAVMRWKIAEQIERDFELVKDNGKRTWIYI